MFNIIKGTVCVKQFFFIQLKNFRTITVLILIINKAFSKRGAENEKYNFNGRRISI
ncbi:hypothetical protein [uncultured Clostridium sp.]|uniref:hypothetical protein n=1 Tax=uncultured Clostridium sp. TaxID=59620 RepID=UPI00280AAC11|nr:hypothetical protein [uncultured Clostridium sp.]